MTVILVLALATLGGVTEIEMILIAKACKEGNIALQYCGVITHKPHHCK